MAINVKIDPDIQHLIKGFEKGAKQFNSKSASKTKLKFAIDEKSFSRPLGKITGQVNMFESAMEAANARVIAFGASTAVLATVVKSLKDLVNVSIEVEAAFADINRILNLSGGNLDKFSNKLFDTAQKTASTFQAASSAALEFSRQGLKTEEVLKRTSDALTLVRLTGMNAKKSVDLLTATVNAFTDLDTTSAVDKFVAVETKFAVAARDLVEGLSRVGSAAIDAKVDFNELNALITAVQQTTGRGGAVIGNALKTIFTRLQRESTLEALERFNVTVRDVQGNILPATQVLDNFAGKYDKLADSTQAYLREQVAGVFQANILSAILKDLNKEQSTFSRALDVSVNATENAAQANEKLNQTMSALLQNTATEFAKLQKNLGDAAFLDLGKGIVGALQTALKSLNSALDKDSTGAGAFFAQGFVSGLSNVLQGPVLIGALQIILKVAKQSFTFLSQAVPTLLNITTQAQKRAQTEEFINNLLRSDVGLTKQIFAAEGDQARQLELVLAKSRAITEQYQAQYRLSTSLGGAIVGGGSFITASGVKGSTASKIKNKAGGYTPSINAEQSAINRGVGGAGSGAYPVVIPNFAFGGGNVGPVVANSSEVMVPNYGGSGGSAIFNQQMISQYGMPNGAVPIASKGLVSKNKKVGRQFEKDVGNAIGVNPSYNSPIDFSSVIRKPVSKGFGPHLYRKNAIADAHSGLGHTASQIISKLLNELHENPESNIKLGWDDTKNTFVLDGGFIEIIGTGKDRRGVTRKSNFSSLGSRAKKRYSDLEGQDFFTKFNQDYVSLSSGYIPNFAAGRGTLSSTANPSKLKAAQAENPFINPLDTGKIGYDRHEVFKLNVRNKKGSTKKGGGKINNEYGALAEKKALPFVKKLGYFPAKNVPGMHNKGSSAVDYIKTSNGLPTGGALTGVLELKAGDIKTNSMFKPLRSITENLHLPIVQNMFKKEGPENLKYESILATKPTARNPYKMTGMMRKGMGGANMARGYVPNFAKGEIFGVSAMTSGGRMGKGKAGKAQVQFEKIALSMSQAGLYGDAISNVLRNTAKSLNLTGETIKNLEPKFKSLSNNASKGNMASYVLGNNLQQTAKASKNQKTLMQKMNKQLQRPGVSIGLMFGAPMLAGLAEQTITGGKSRLDQTANQRFFGSAASNVTSFATSGAMIAGPYGAIAGALIGLGKAAMDTSLSLEELKEKADNYEKTTQSVTSAAEEYIQAQKDALTATSDKELEDAQKRAANSLEILNKSGLGLGETFEKNSGDIDVLTQSLSTFTDEAKDKLTLLRAGSKAKAIEEKGGFKLKEKAIPIDKMSFFQKMQLNADPYGASSKQLMEYSMSDENTQNLSEVLGVLGQVGQYDFKMLEDELRNRNNEGFEGIITALMLSNQNLANRAEELEELFGKLGEIGAGRVKSRLIKIIKDGQKAEQERLDKTAEEKAIQRARLITYQDVIKTLNSSSLLLEKELNFATRKNKLFSARAGSAASLLSVAGGDVISSNLQAAITRSGLDLSEQKSQSGFAKGTSKTIIDALQKEAAYSQEDIKAAGTIVSALADGTKSLSEIIFELSNVFNNDSKNFSEDFKYLIEELKQNDNDRKATIQDERTIAESNIKIQAQRAINTEKERQAAREYEVNQINRSLASGARQQQGKMAILGFEDRQARLGMQAGIDPYSRMQEGFRLRKQILDEEQKMAKDETNMRIEDISAKAAIEVEQLKSQKELILSNYELVAAIKGTDPQTWKDIQNVSGLNRDQAISYYGSEQAALSAMGFAGSNPAAGLNASIAQAEDLTKKRIALEKQGNKNNLDYQDEALAKEKARAGLAYKNARSVSYGFKTGMDQVRQDIALSGNQLAKDIPMQFRDGMVSAMEATLDKTKDLKGALTDMAMDFMRIMRRQALQNIVGSVMTIGGKQQGGFIKAQNGMYISGNRTGDRNPAMLEDGEYVLNRNAVRSLGGPSAIDRLNFGIAPRFKGGGAFLNMGVDSGRMSSKYFAGNDPLLGEMRDAAIAAEQRRQEKKAKKTALRNMIIQTAVSAAISSGASAMKNKPKTMAQNAKIAEGDFYDNPDNFNFQNGGYISTGPRNMDSVPAFMAGGEFVMNNKAVKKYGLGFMSRINGGYIPGYQSGGSVAESAEKLGSSNSSNTNNINISINMGSGSNESEGGSEGNDQSGTSDEKTKAKDLSEKVKTVVLQVINEEQRTGGSLSKTKVAR